MINLRPIARLSLILVVAFFLGATAAFFQAVNRPVSSTGTVSLTVNQGQGPRVIAATLKERGLLAHERPFFTYVLLAGKRNSFYPGTYELHGGMTIRQIVEKLTDPKRQQLTVRVLEGWRINDIAAEVAKKTKVTADEFKAAAPVEEYEGYLFPDTYYLTEEMGAAEIVKTMRDNFAKRTKDLALTADDVILASIVEREAQTDEDRPKVAGVYLNRLAIKMALQADPTVQYAKGSWDPITVADYRNVQSPYNTYLHPGLPPTPISNPGLKALQAVKSPAEHEYYYFIHTADGSTYYAETLDQHNENKRQYLR